MEHLPFDHSFRTLGGESLGMFFIGLIVLIALYLNHWHFSRRFIVSDVNGHVVSRHFTVYGGYLSRNVLNRLTNEETYTLCER